MLMTLSAASDEQKSTEVYNELEEGLRKFGLELAPPPRRKRRTELPFEFISAWEPLH